jgi:DNA-directed RNA polymerase specialized sigma24 family protein
MPLTFEELVGRDLDSLYRGALFLAGGQETDAEDLLSSTLREAFHAYRSAGVSSAEAENWLEGRLVMRALVELDGLSLQGTAPKRALYRGAAEIPLRARVALWLVLMRRWSYAATAERLQVDRDGLRELLSYRERLALAIEPLTRTAGNG